MKGELIIIFLTTLAVTLAQQPNWVTTIIAKCVSSGEKSNCLGAIIANDRLITTGSCFSHCSADDSITMKFVAMEDSASGQSLKFKVDGDGITTHSEFATSQAVDFALVKFNNLKYQLAKATITDRCRQINSAKNLSIINYVKEKLVSMSPIARYDGRECKKLFPGWLGLKQSCFDTTECVEKPGSFIADGNMLYCVTTFNSGCTEGSNRKAGLLICKYYQWIQDQLATPTGSTSQPTTPTTQPTTTPSTQPPTPKRVILPVCPPPPEIENGKVKYTPAFFGGVAAYECDEGYTMKGRRKKLICVGTKWNRNPPSCVEIPTKPPAPVSTTCDKPPKVTKALVDIPDTFEEGAVAKYSCATRYRLVGDNKLTCRGGRWTGVVPRCQDCPPFQLPNGKFRYLNTSVFLYVTGMVCNPGHQLNGRGINHCENGQWKYTQSCDIKQCPIPEDIPIGTVRYRNPPVHGSLAVYSCPRPYVVSGFQRRLCNNGKWEGYPPKCKIITSCRSYDILPCGSTSNNGGLRVGATVTYSPASNTMLIGPSVITCQPDGTWSSPMPKCRRMCPIDFTLENGDHELIMDNTKLDYDMEMTCKPGYKMKGVSKFKCNGALGAWNRFPSQTKCYKGCSCLNVQNGNAICQEFGDFQFATVSCNRGYKLQGNSPAICQFGSYLTTASCVRQ